MSELILPDEYWQEQWSEATNTTDAAAVDAQAPNLLVVANAQHPLHEGRPGPEMRQRLDSAAEYYNVVNERTIAAGGMAMLYVPGSIHGTDRPSLAEAGGAYLQATHGMPAAAIHGEDWNRQYRPDGVRTGADEAYVASRAFKDTAHAIGSIVVAASPEQTERTWRHYLANDVNPTFLPVRLATDSSAYHDGVTEKVLRSYTNRIDPDWQASGLRGALPGLIRWTRRER